MRRKVYDLSNMPNQEHLNVLGRGVSAWNRWREEHARTLPNLSCATLKEANLREADLRGTDLQGADLTSACLDGAALIAANLRGAKLPGAGLIGANLRGADLSEADLSEAYLNAANLISAKLNGAVLTNAHFFETVFGDTALVDAQGLDSCIHEGPSTIDHRTLARLAQSQRPPVLFLRGCGLPDHLIAYLRSLLNQPIQFYSCFISYSTKDQEFAERLHTDLQAKGVRCWFAPEDLKIGDKFRARIDESIRVYDKLLLILSEHSIASPWVEDEVEAAIERERRDNRTVLFPIRTDDAVMDTNVAWAATLRRTRHLGDFREWKDHDSHQKALTRLMRNLKTDAEGANSGRG